jgi:NADPH2:quinone reductase
MAINMNEQIQRRVARALRAGGPEVIEVGVEVLPPPKAGEVLVRVEAAGLNHAETLIRSGNYAVSLPFPYPLGGEGAGVVVSTGPEVSIAAGTRVCWATVIGSCATFLTAPASMLVPIPNGLTFEDAACLAVAGLTAGGLARVWPLEGRDAVVWGAGGAVGRMLVATLANQQVNVIGIASRKRIDAVRAAGAAHVIDRGVEDVTESVRAITNGRGVAAVFDPIGALTYETSLQLLAPRGCLVNYGELSGPLPALNVHQLFRGSLFVTKYNGMHWVEGLHEIPALISDALALASKQPAVISEVAGRFALSDVVDAYRRLESDSHGKVLVLPGL